MSYAIETSELTYSFAPGRPVVDRLSLQVPSGAIYGFLGPNGAGKTTTIRLLTGLLLSEKDNIHIHGQSLQHTIPGVYTSMGTLIETPSLYQHLTAKENLAVIATLRGISKARIDEVLETVGLSYMINRKAKIMSLGMKQRLGIAMALLSDPELLILDEPANGLDPQGIIEIRELLIRLNREQGKTIFVSSHLLHEIEKTCTHIGIIHLGRLLYQGTLDDLKRQAHSAGEVVFTIADASGWADRVPAIIPEMTHFHADKLVVPYTNPEDVIQYNQKLVQAGVPVTGMSVSGGLEEWFIRLINKTHQIQ